MIAIESPTAARVAATASRPSSRPARIHADLERAESLLAQAQRGLGPLRRRQQHPARGVGGDPVEAPPNSVATGSPATWPDDVPERRLERPEATGMEVDRLERRGRGGRWPAGPGRGTGARTPRTRPSCRPSRSRRCPRRSRRGRASRERGPRHRIPRRRERRVERHAQTLQPDGGDPHAPSIADAGTRPRAGRYLHVHVIKRSHHATCGTLTAPRPTRGAA